MTAETMSEGRTSGEFREGVRAGLPVVIAAAPFGVLFGALAVDNGFSVFEATAMSAMIFGGASQMVGIELFGQSVPPWLIVLSIFAVNFRHVLYSGVIGRRIGHWPAARQALGFFFLTDPQYAEAEVKAGRGEAVGFAWYLGMALPIYVLWVAEAWIGAAFGNMMTDLKSFGIEFLLPIYFLGLVMEFRERPLWLPTVIVSAIASVTAYYTIGSPWHVSIGAAAGILLAVVLPPSAAVTEKAK